LVSDAEIQKIATSKNPSPQEITNRKDIEFWKKRLASDSSSETNNVMYANTLEARFHLYGNIEDLKLANTIIEKFNMETKGSQAGLNRKLSTFASLQHRFKDAKSYSEKALKIGENRYASELQMFDTAFELGNMPTAKTLLKKLKKNYEYAYYFRLSKMYHYDGDIDEAIKAMKRASELTNGNINLEQIALSNLADLYLHNGDFESASENYKKSIALDAADFHSLAGLGTVALIHDKNPQAAKMIFDFVNKKTKSPDILLKYIHLAQTIGDQNMEKKYALEFEKMVTNSNYGNMYNKYLFELYDGILNDKKALLNIAEKEQSNRETPQTIAWYAWALYKNNKNQKALEIYKNQISGMPLEGLELYYMGKMMLSENKKYNAKQYFEAANKNKYDLSPSKRKDLEALI
jgi:Tfp pilus assembly protein PilF